MIMFNSNCDLVLNRGVILFTFSIIYGKRCDTENGV